jgi:phosphatidylglycerol lysyltransferase
MLSMVLSNTEVLLKWHERWGYNPHGFVSILPNALTWTDPRGRGAISYFSAGNTWLASDPFAPEEEVIEVARSFLSDAGREGKLVSFVPATSRFAMHAGELRMDAVPIGASPYFDLKTWAPRGDRAKKVRSAVNQSRRSGLIVEEVCGRQICKTEVDTLCTEWLKTRRTVTFGWVFTLDPLRFCERKRFFVARAPCGRLLGLLAASPIPARNGWYLEDVLRHPEAPNGTSDLLIVEAMALLGRTGSSVATLGTVLASYLELGEPLRRGHHVVARTMFRIFGTHMEALYNFQGLRRFKTKFSPSWWEPEFVMFPPGMMHSTRVVAATARAVSCGKIFDALWKGAWNPHRHSSLCE